MRDDRELSKVNDERSEENVNKKKSLLPWKMIIHILLVASTTTQAVLIISSTTSYTRAQERMFYNMFVDDSEKTDVSFKRFTYLYSVSELKAHLSKSVQNFFDMKETSLEAVRYENDKPTVKMEFNYIDNSLLHKEKNFETTSFITQHNIKREFLYTITNTTLGPFDNSDSNIKDFLNDVVEFKLNYLFKTYIPYLYYDNYECFNWGVSQSYNFENRGHFVARISINRSPCTDIRNKSISLFDTFINKLIWIHLITLILGTISLITTWRYIYKIAILYGKVREEYKLKKKNVPQKDIYISGSKDSDYYNPLLDKDLDKVEETDQEEEKSKKGQFPHPPQKKKLLNGWSILCLCGNIVQIFASGLSLFDTDNVLIGTEILVGFGCMLAFFNIARYLDNYSDYSTLTETLRRSLPNVLRYLFGVMPIFFGFLFFGLCLFWRSERFNNTSTTMMSLFAMMNGDSLFETFYDLSGFSFFLGQLYCYMFCIMFIVVVMNVFIAIIEEAYITIKMTNRNHWIYAYLKLDEKDRRLEMKEDKFETKSTMAIPHLNLANIEKKNSFLNEKLNIKSYKTNVDFGNHQKSFKAEVFKQEKVDNNDLSSQTISNQIRTLDNMNPELKTSKKYEKSKADIEKGLELIFQKIETNYEDIIKLCEEITKLKDPELKNDLTENIFDHNNLIESKINMIRETLIKK